MLSVWSRLRTGEWVTGSRLRAYGLILVILYAAAAFVWVGLSHGGVDRLGRPVGTDFSNVYAAGRLALTGHAADAYDWAREHAVEKAVFDRDVPFYGWHYPPQFLVIAGMLALLPYGGALAVWLAATLAGYLAMLRSIVPHALTPLIALAFPAAFVNIGHGQNGFFTAALLGGALLLLERRPIAAGVLIGLLAYKPQFGILIPLVLIATARWRAIVSASATVIATCALTVLFFGTTVWRAFWQSTSLTSHIVLEQGATGWHKIQSVFSAVRMWGGGIDTAYAAQIAIGAAVAIALVRLWRSGAAFELKAAALTVGSLLATPYILDYDLTILAVAIAMYVRHLLKHGHQNFELSLLAIVFTAPLAARAVALQTFIPLGLAAQLTMLMLIFLRARREADEPTGSAVLAQA